MAKNLKKYYQAWKLRQQGKTFKEIGKTMGISKSRVNQLVHFIEGKIKCLPAGRQARNQYLMN